MSGKLLLGMKYAVRTALVQPETVVCFPSVFSGCWPTQVSLTPSILPPIHPPVRQGFPSFLDFYIGKCIVFPYDSFCRLASTSIDENKRKLKSTKSKTLQTMVNDTWRSNGFLTSLLSRYCTRSLDKCDNSTRKGLMGGLLHCLLTSTPNLIHCLRIKPLYCGISCAFFGYIDLLMGILKEWKIYRLATGNESLSFISDALTQTHLDF